MTTDRHVVFFHAPNSRSVGARVLLEELNAEYALHALNLKAGESRKADYLAVNPMGKVPAIKHGDVLVTEQPAVYMYLAELYPEAGLSPTVGDPLRGPYLRWMVFYGSCFEPAVLDRAMKREPAPPGMSPYGDFDTTLNTLTQQLAKGPWMLGETFTAVDVLWGMGLTWTTGFKLVPELPEIKAYLERFNARPAVARARAKDAELAASLA
jgi:glutathione S-transferase